VAPPAGTLRVGRYFLALAILLGVLYAIVFWPGQRHTPKLGLDLVGGTQVIFTAKAPGGKAPSKSAMDQAKEIMTERVNGSGVTEAQVVVQGSDQIVISIPGSTDADVSKLGQAAVLNFRGLVAPITAVTCTPKSATSSGASRSASPSAAKSGNAAAPDGGTHRQLFAAAAPSGTATSSGAAKSSPPASQSSGAGAGTTPATGGTSVTSPTCTDKPFAALEKKKVEIPTSSAAFDKLSSTQQQEVVSALANFDCAAAQDEPDLPNKYFVACDDGSRLGRPYAYLLGTVIVPGKQISSASAVAPNVSNGQTSWSVSLSLKSKGQAAWAKYTSAHNIGGSNTASADPTSCSSSTTPCANFVGFTLDGVVISAPVNEQAINGGNTQITGNFTSSSAHELARQLKYGALPLSFTADQAQTVSATLGTSQLKSGLLAGGIGLGLVIIYSLLYYRALGLVTISSLAVSALLVYGSIVMLGTQMGFTLSLAGIAGFIVAVGITADSFVVFFERIKDEVHEGRSAKVAIPRAWVRARRTILSADTVSVLAAAILYYFAAGDVKGFAFTLGLSTILDLIVVFLFTHPLVSLLSRLRAFGSKRITGLDAIRAGESAPAPAPRPRSSRRPGSARAASATAEPDPAPAAVAVLERDGEERDAEEAEDAIPADQPVEDASAPPVAVHDTPAADDGDAAAPDDDATEPAERRRTAPARGSAAERAAARRARLRAGDDGKGES
jgi:preprotein translocase subunit SecD